MTMSAMYQSAEASLLIPRPDEHTWLSLLCLTKSMTYPGGAKLVKTSLSTADLLSFPSESRIGLSCLSSRLRVFETFGYSGESPVDGSNEGYAGSLATR